MTVTYKVLGQVAPAAGNSNTIYTVPASTQTIVSTINVCNPDSTNRAFRLAVVPSGNTLAQKHYLAYDTPISNLDSIALTLGITMGANDSVVVYANGSSNLSFSVFGSEIT
jgi:glucose-6-phosphate dehydrogenase assembly protein OpcA